MPGRVTRYDKYKPPRLRAQRFWLEPLTAEEHAARLFAPLSDPKLYEFIPGGPPASAQALWDRYTRLQTRRSPDRSELWLNWAVKSTDREYVGLVEATVKKDASAQVAYFIFVPHQRHGFGAKAVTLVIEHLVQDLGIKVARALVDTRNIASQRLLKRVGFERKRTIKDADHFKGATSDEYEYELRLAP